MIDQAGPKVVSTAFALPQNDHAQAKTGASTVPSARRPQPPASAVTVPAPFRAIAPVPTANQKNSTSLSKDSFAIAYEKQYLMIEHVFTGAVRRGPMRKNSAAYLKQNPDWQLLTNESGFVAHRKYKKQKQGKKRESQVGTLSQSSIAPVLGFKQVPDAPSTESQHHFCGSGVPQQCATSIAFMPDTNARETQGIAAATKAKSSKAVSTSTIFMVPTKRRKSKQQDPEHWRRPLPRSVISIAYPQDCTQVNSVSRKSSHASATKLTTITAATKEHAQNKVSASATEQSILGHPPSRVCQHIASSTTALPSSAGQPAHVPNPQQETRPHEYVVQEVLDQIMHLPYFLQCSSEEHQSRSQNANFTKAKQCNKKGLDGVGPVA